MLVHVCLDQNACPDTGNIYMYYGAYKRGSSMFGGLIYFYFSTVPSRFCNVGPRPGTTNSTGSSPPSTPCSRLLPYILSREKGSAFSIFSPLPLAIPIAHTRAFVGFPLPFEFYTRKRQLGGGAQLVDKIDLRV